DEAAESQRTRTLRGGEISLHGALSSARYILYYRFRDFAPQILTIIFELRPVTLFKRNLVLQKGKSTVVLYWQSKTKPSKLKPLLLSP
ncbi:MAG: hypothetical protein ACXVBZ_14065, partial [Flavisolibacter sp.]